MSNYEKQNFVSGQILKAEHLNHMEDGIGQLSEEIVDKYETLSDMVEGTPVKEKCAEFSALMRNTGEVESFIFFTDPHLLAAESDYETEFRKYIRMLKTYYVATPTSFVVCGGDWLELHSRSEACFRLGYADAWMRNNFDRYYPTVGNHDHNTNTSGVAYPEEDDVGVLPINDVRNLMMRSEKNTYYTFDGDNTTFYVLDSGPAWWSMTAHMWEQIAWLADELKTKDAKNSAIIVHAAYEADSSGEIVLQAFMTNVLALCSAYNDATTITLNDVDYNFSGCTGKMRFVLSGHKHGKDYHEMVNGIQVVRTTNMRTGSSPTFELCLADYDNNLLHLVRVGSGSSRTLELARPNTPYPDDTMAFLAYVEPGSTAIQPVAKDYGCVIGTVATDVKYTDSENSIEYFALIKPYGTTKVSVKCPGLQGVFCERGANGTGFANSGWIDDEFEYEFQNETWYYFLKFRTKDGSDFKDYDTGKISWEFSGQSSTSYTNQIRTSISKDGAAYNGFGYKPFTRIGTATGVEVDHATYCATGFIPAKGNDMLRVKNISTTGESAVIYFNKDFSFITARYLNNPNQYSIDENGVLTGNIVDNGSIAFIRVTGDFYDNPIVTINEEIT